LLPSTSINLLIFSFPLYAYIFVLVASIVYPNQKYILWRQLPNGDILKVETLTKPISREEAISRHGVDRYFFQSMKPRAKTLWNDLLRSPKKGSKKNEDHNIDLQPLERKTDYLGYGLIGSFGTQALGFGLSHSRFSQIEDRVAKVETALRSLPVQGLVCTLCSTPILTMLQESCAGCGNPIEWSKTSPTENSTSRRWSLP